MIIFFSFVLDVGLLIICNFRLKVASKIHLFMVLYETETTAACVLVIILCNIGHVICLLLVMSAGV